ncbi:hypothetical protein RJ640_025792 [Escallonia rubra]|uniref:Pectinesterase inhibitor domain-containing protein n=1 Tax=Escallonia rubra TaxID=112253 RepID=A0AA88QQ89_9ASTE|nr:hypothetical protein RJ640_025792 [Escallonia rubra]
MQRVVIVSALLLSLLAAILVPNLTLANASVKSSSQLISEVCSKVPNSALCLEAFKSDPRSANADLVGLGRISIDLTKSATKTTYELINSLLNKTSDRRLRGRYDFCSVCYGRAVNDLDDSEKSLSSGKYLELNNFAAAALGENDLCEDNFDVQPEELKEAIQKAGDLCYIILSIAKLSNSCATEFNMVLEEFDDQMTLLGIVLLSRTRLPSALTVKTPYECDTGLSRFATHTGVSGKLLYHIPKYRLLLEPLGEKKPSSKLWPEDTKVWPSVRVSLKLMVSAAVQDFGTENEMIRKEERRIEGRASIVKKKENVQMMWMKNQMHKLK